MNTAERIERLLTRSMLETGQIIIGIGGDGAAYPRVAVVSGGPDDEDGDVCVEIDDSIGIDQITVKVNSITGPREAKHWRVYEWRTHGGIHTPPENVDVTVWSGPNMYEAVKIAALRPLWWIIDNVCEDDSITEQVQEWEEE